MTNRLNLLFFGVVCFSAFMAVCAVTISDTASPPVRSISELDRAALPVNDTDGLPCIPFSGAVDARYRVAIIGVRCQNGTVVGRIPVNETVSVVRSQFWVVNMTTDPATIMLNRTLGPDIFVDPRDTAALRAATPGVIASRIPSPPGSPQAANVVFVAIHRQVGYVYTSSGGSLVAGATFALPSATWFAEASFVAKTEDFFVLATNIGIHKIDMAGVSLGSITFPSAVSSVAIGLDPQETRLYAAIPGKVIVATLGSVTEQLTQVAETTFASDLGEPTTVWYNHYVRNGETNNIVVTTSNIINSQRRNYAFKCTIPANTISCDTTNKYTFDKDYLIKSVTSPAIQPPRPQGATGVYYSADAWMPTVYYLDDDESAIGFNVTAMSQNEIYRSASIVDGGKLGNFLPSQSFAVVPTSGELLVWSLYRDFVQNGTSLVLTYTLFPPRDLWLNQNNNGANRNVGDVDRGWLIGGVIAAVIVVLVLLVAIILIVRHKKLKGKEGSAPAEVAQTPRGSVVSLEESD